MMLSIPTPAARVRPTVPRFKLQDHPVKRDDLDEALLRGQLVAMFQPQVNPVNGQVVQLEATLRWLHPRRGLLLPGDFMCEADQYGRLEEIAAVLLQQTALASRGLEVPVAACLSGAVLRDHRAQTRFHRQLAAFDTIDLDGCDDTRADLMALLEARGHPSGLALTNLGTLLQWYIAAELRVGLVQGDFVSQPVPRGQVAATLQRWRAAFAAIAAAAEDLAG